MSVRPVHLCRGWSDITACGKNRTLTALDYAAVWGEVTCKLCKNTTAFKNLRNETARTEGVMPSTETVGIPTHAEEPKPEPLVHMADGQDNPQAYCGRLNDEPKTGFSTMDLDAVTCEWCRSTLEFKVRDSQREAIAAGHEPDDDPIYESDINDESDLTVDEYNEVMARAAQQDMRGTGVVRDHDAPWRPYPHQGMWTHDCDRCFFLGTHERHDLYFCRQSNNKGTVIARWGNLGGEYKSGIWSAKQEPLLALALVRAVHRGLVTGDDIKEI